MLLYVFAEKHNASQSRASEIFKFNLSKLYNTICKIPNTDEVTLLFYMLLHRNSSVKQDIMRRPDIQLLVSDLKVSLSFLAITFIHSKMFVCR